jgi:hypothetical protein
MREEPHGAQLPFALPVADAGVTAGTRLTPRRTWRSEQW